MSQQQRSEEQEVRDLIAGAGPRPAVPAAEVAKIKAAAREEWRQMVERERRHRRALRRRGALAVAAGVLLAVAVGWWWSTRTVPLAAPVVATLELLAGSARADGSELAVGDSLSAGALLETGAGSGEPSTGAALRLGGGQSLRLTAGSGVRLVGERRLELRRGTLYVDSDVAAAAASLEVVTPLGTVRDIGTQFEVRLSAGGSALRVRVREGEVALEAAGNRHLAVRGEQLTLTGDGSVSRAGIETYGPEWAWVLATAPGIPIEGRSLGTVLSWVERESGREIRYQDAALAADVDEIVVGGSAEGLTPMEVLGVVLRGSGGGGLRHRVENGTILITR